MGRIFQKPRTHTEYTVPGGGVILVDNASHKITGYKAKFEALGGVPYPILGREVYASKGRLIDVESGDVLANYTRWVKINLPG